MVISLVQALWLKAKQKQCWSNECGSEPGRVRKRAQLWGVSWSVSSPCAATVAACKCNLRFVGLSVSDGILLSAFELLCVGCRSGLIHSGGREVQATLCETNVF